MMKTDVMLMHDQNLLRNLLYKISVRLPMTRHQGMLQDQMTIQIDIAVEVHLVITIREIAHFPIHNYYNLHFSTTSQNQFFPTTPHTYFYSKFRTTFNFIESFTDEKPDNCATNIQNSTNHVATLPTGHFGHIENPVTNENPKYYQVNDISTRKHNVTYTYHPESPEPIPQTNYSVSPNHDTFSTAQFSLHQVHMTKFDTLQKTSSLYNVLTTSHTSKPRVFEFIAILYRKS